MGVYKRATQFSPFMALKGYEGMLWEQSRERTEKAELLEDGEAELSMMLGAAERGRLAEVVYYETDAYVSKRGIIEKVDREEGSLIVDGTKIQISDVYALTFPETL